MTEPTLTITVKEAARLVPCSDDTIYRALANGLPHVKVGSRKNIKIHREGFENWLRDAAERGLTL